MTLLGQNFRKYPDTNNCIMWEKNKKFCMNQAEAGNAGTENLGPIQIWVHKLL